jgi:hypothetical protein
MTKPKQPPKLRPIDIPEAVINTLTESLKIDAVQAVNLVMALQDDMRRGSK